MPYVAVPMQVDREPVDAPAPSNAGRPAEVPRREARAHGMPGAASPPLSAFAHPGVARAAAHGTNGGGWAVGAAWAPGTRIPRAFVALRDGAEPLLLPDGEACEAVAVSEVDAAGGAWVLGNRLLTPSAAFPAGAYAPVVWRAWREDGGFASAPPCAVFGPARPAASARGLAIRAVGEGFEVVGALRYPHAPDDERAFLADGAASVDLTDALLDNVAADKHGRPYAPWRVACATGFTAGGWIIGRGVYAAGTVGARACALALVPVSGRAPNTREGASALLTPPRRRTSVAG